MLNLTNNFTQGHYLGVMDEETKWLAQGHTAAMAREPGSYPGSLSTESVQFTKCLSQAGQVSQHQDTAGHWDPYKLLTEPGNPGWLGPFHCPICCRASPRQWPSITCAAALCWTSR